MIGNNSQIFNRAVSIDREKAKKILEKKRKEFYADPFTHQHAHSIEEKEEITNLLPTVDFAIDQLGLTFDEAELITANIGENIALHLSKELAQLIGPNTLQLLTLLSISRSILATLALGINSSHELAATKKCFEQLHDTFSRTWDYAMDKHFYTETEVINNDKTS